jgi:hypothetical protein
MRDIRDDLRERLSAIDRDLVFYQHKIEDLEDQKEMLQALLNEENRRWGMEEAPSKKSRELQDIICEIMSDGGTWFGGTVVGALIKRGFDFGAAKPGRVVHFTLLGMSRRNLVEHVGDSTWKLKPQRDLINDNAA